MGTPVHIPDELYKQAESLAAQEGIPVGDLIVRGLRLAMGGESLARGSRIVFPLHHSIKPGVLSSERVQAAEDASAQQEDDARAGTV